jgi:GGDEF domain-containing protein
MPVITDLWLQPFDILVVCEMPATVERLRHALPKDGRWHLSHVLSLPAEGIPSLEPYGVIAIDLASARKPSVLKYLSAHYALSVPVVLLVDQYVDSVDVSDPDQVIDSVFPFLEAAPVIESGRTADLLFRYLLNQRTKNIHHQDIINFDAETGFGRLARLHTVLDIAMGEAVASNSFVALLALKVDWQDENGEPIPFDPGLEKQFAQRLEKVRRQSDFVFNDDAGWIDLVLARLPTSREIDTAAQRLLDGLLEPFEREGQIDAYPRIAIGIAHTLGDASSAQAMIDQARDALNKSVIQMAESDAGPIIPDDTV